MACVPDVFNRSCGRPVIRVSIAVVRGTGCGVATGGRRLFAQVCKQWKETLRSLSGALGRAVFLARLLVPTLPRRCFTLLMSDLSALARGPAVEMQGPTAVSFSTNKGPPGSDKVRPCSGSDCVQISSLVYSREYGVAQRGERRQALVIGTCQNHRMAYHPVWIRPWTFKSCPVCSSVWLVACGRDRSRQGWRHSARLGLADPHMFPLFVSLWPRPWRNPCCMLPNSALACVSASMAQA